MPRLVTSLCSAMIALFPLAAVAAPDFPPAPAAAPSHLVRVQGWWEEEHREDAFRDRYWHLPPGQRERYDQFEFRIRQLQERQRHEIREGDRRDYYELTEQIEQMRREQYRILHLWE
jgi:hypothetical protein